LRLREMLDARDT